MKFTSRQVLILIGGIVALAGGLFLVSVNLRSESKPPEVELIVWGTEPNQYFEEALRLYKEVRPNVTVTYERIAEAGYDEKLLNALASASGPDVFMIGSRGLPREKGKLAPAAATQMNIKRMRELYPTVVEQDFVSGGSVYALPLYIDTLALLYNRDLFDSAGVVAPPKTWDEFQNAVARLREIAENGQIVRAGAAMGGSMRTIPNAADTVYALMLQNGAAMTDANFTNALFASDAGLEAFNFYLRFADPASSAYTWNDTLAPAVEGLAGGKTAMMLGYKADADAIAKKSPFVSLGVAGLPQQAGAAASLTYGAYRGFAVSKQSKAAEWGWDFTVFIASNKNAHEAYVKASGRPPALRSAIAERLADPEIGVFAKQALTARSWHQANPSRIAEIFDDAIRGVLRGEVDSQKALRQAKEQVDQLMRR